MPTVSVQKTWNIKGETAALPPFQRAVELDPQFAMAYARIGSAYRNLDEPALAAENMRKAFRLREKTSERERLYIEARYYRWVTGESDKWEQVCELWKHIYPRDRLPYNELAHLYSLIGSYERSVELAQEALRLEPEIAASYANLDNYYLGLNRLDDAAAVLKQAEERKLEGLFLAESRYHLAFVRGNTEEMKRVIAEAAGKPAIENLLLSEQASVETYHGRLAAARELRGRAVRLARDKGAVEAAAVYLAQGALEEAYLGEAKQARANAYEAMKLARDSTIDVDAALSLALAGDIKNSQNLASEIDRKFPVDTRVQRYWLPTVRAVVSLRAEHAYKAIEVLELARPYELGPLTGINGCLCPAYARGEAYMMVRDGKAAAVEFQKLIDHRALVRFFPLGAMARIGLARAYAMQGDTVKARSAYEDFFTLWKDADPDISILKQAKVEYPKLQ